MKKILLNIILFFPITFLVFSIVLVCSLSGKRSIDWTPLMFKREFQFRKENLYTKQHWVPLSQISAETVKAIVMSEDDRFFNHNGVDIIEIENMYYSYKRGDKELRGCSTISQQVAKNCFTFSNSTILRKVAELYWTSLIEIFWTKERILEVYLNVMEVGKGLYGIEAAANEYFHCTSKEMTLHDAAELAVCLPLPLKVTPFNVWRESPSKVERLLFRLKKGDYLVWRK